MKKIDAIIRVIIFLCILFLCLMIVHHITKRKDAYEKTKDFFTQEENFDVLFFGSSHTVNGIFPMELWDNYGIVSYNLGKYGEHICTTYYNLILALEQTKPKLVVIDTYLAKRTAKINESSYVHESLDAYPLSYKKYLAIKDLFDGKNLVNNEIEYLFNFSIYHARWNQLSERDFKNINTYEKGGESRIAVANPDKVSIFDSIAVFNEEENINMIYLRKIIQYCKEHNIEILLTYLPFPALDEDISISKYVQKISEEYDINCINFLNIDNVVNYSIDFCDKNSHLNPSGARKITEYLGKYIMDKYNIPNQKNNTAYYFWNEDYNEYIDLKIKNLAKNEKNLNNYLMLLYNEKDIKYEITMSSKRTIDDTLQQLLTNIDNNYKVDDTVFENEKDKTIKITTYDNRTNCLIKTIWF